jgi:hypothetical protein
MIARFAALGVLLPLLGCGAGDAGAPLEAPVFRHGVSGTKPWTHERFGGSGTELRFAIFSDLNGGERAGVFDVAVAQLELLRPDLVLSVGDLIDGASETAQGLHAEWEAFDARTRRSSAPVFYVGGNHDLTSPRMREVWGARYGPLYYWFRYRDVLFLALDSEDHTDERRRAIHEARLEAIALIDAGEEERARQGEYYRMPERVSGNVGEEQVRYFEQALAANPDVRWTFLFMHKPIWRDEDSPGLLALEAALGDRPYTFFSGHLHSYSLTRRRGRDYVTLGTTGGGQARDDAMSFDHVTLVDLAEREPSIVNLRLSGILDVNGQLPAGGEELCFQASSCGP